MTGTESRAKVFRSVVRGRWCPITEHFLSDDGIPGFQHYVEHFPEVRCDLDWSEHPTAERITEIRLAGDHGSSGAQS